jgi:hypothetical protein
LALLASRNSKVQVSINPAKKLIPRGNRWEMLVKKALFGSKFGSYCGDIAGLWGEFQGLVGEIGQNRTNHREYLRLIAELNRGNRSWKSLSASHA